MGDENMKVKTVNSFTLKIYLHNRRRPIELEGLTESEANTFNVNATSKMFVKYGPVIIRTESIDYVVILQK